MAKYQILYWQDIPTQVKAWDEYDEVKLELDPRFMALVDAKAQQKGLTGSEDYLSHFKWSDEKERDGEADVVADIIKIEIEESINL
jgi:hypothetical protein